MILDKRIRLNAPDYLTNAAYIILIKKRNFANSAYNKSVQMTAFR